MKETLMRLLKSTILIQLIGLVITPLMYIKFNESEFATYGLFFSISAILSVFLSGRLENLFFSLNEYKKFYIFSFISCFFISITLFLILFFMGRIFYSICLLCGFSIAIFNLGYNFLVREGREELYNRIKISRALMELLAVLSLFLIDFNINTLLLIFSLSYLICGLYIFFNNKVGDYKLNQGYFIFLNNIKYIKYDFFSSMMNSLYIYLPTLYFSALGDNSSSSKYFLILRIFGVPSLMIAQSISVAVRQHASKEFQDKKNIIKTYNYFYNFFGRMLIPFLIIVILTYLFFAFLDIFYVDGMFTYTLCLIFLFYVRSFYNCLSGIVYVFKWQLSNFFFQLCLLVVSFLSLKLNFFDVDSIHFYSIFSSLVYLCYMLIIYNQAKSKGYI